jgi:dTDP-4-amino-4,6-dideoxygalactose transaminase
MSELSEAMLKHAMNWEDISVRRRKNYLHLQEKIGEFALIPLLDDATVPLGFPVRVANRNSIREALFRAEIYPPVHWPINECVPDEFTESHTLSREIMTLPCDQRYNEEDLDRMIEVFKRATVR